MTPYPMIAQTKAGVASTRRSHLTAHAPVQPGTVWISLSIALALWLLAGLAHPSVALAQGPSTVPEAGWPELTIEPLDTPFDRPMHATHAGDGSGRLFVVERPGVIRIWKDGALLPIPFLQMPPGVVDPTGECGMLSVAFPPDFAQSGVFYVYYNTGEGRVSPPFEDEPNGGCDSVISRFRISAENPDVADSASEEPILEVNQPYDNHNGGQIAFGPDGYLYIGLGDGGSGGDPLNAGQRPETLLGKLLRIQVGATGPYSVPADNPLVGQAGARPEIWALGLRNPWRFAFDRLTGDLYIGDVGQNEYEEVSFQAAGSTGGENYGWRKMEGFHCFDPSDGCQEPEFVLPVVEYAHNSGNCSVTGGVVGRDPLYPRLNGIYLYADYCSGRIWGLTPDGQGGWVNQSLLDTPYRIISFGEDQAGGAYFMSSDGRLFRLGDTQTDLAVSLSQSPWAYTPGESISYRLQVTNLGKERVERLNITPVLPSALLDVTYQVGTGAFDAPAGVWTGVDLAGGESETLTLTARVADDATGPLDVGLTAAAGDVFDPFPANNSAGIQTKPLSAFVETIFLPSAGR